MHYYCIPGIPEIERLEIQKDEKIKRIIKICYSDRSIPVARTKHSRKYLAARCLYKFVYLRPYDIPKLLNLTYRQAIDAVYSREGQRMQKAVGYVKNKIFGF